MLPDLLAGACSRLPRFRGKGRLVLLLDRWLTDQADPASYLAVGEVNGGCRLLLDLRLYVQKFAFSFISLLHPPLS